MPVLGILSLAATTVLSGPTSPWWNVGSPLVIANGQVVTEFVARLMPGSPIYDPTASLDIKLPKLGSPEIDPPLQNHSAQHLDSGRRIGSVSLFICTLALSANAECRDPGLIRQALDKLSQMLLNNKRRRCPRSLSAATAKSGASLGRPRAAPALKTDPIEFEPEPFDVEPIP